MAGSYRVPIDTAFPDPALAEASLIVMDPIVLINERVEVVAIYRRQGVANLLCIPSKMRWQGKEISLTELALRHPTVAGKRMIHVFHVSDGANGYRLEFDAEALTWTLAAVLPATTEELA